MTQQTGSTGAQAIDQSTQATSTPSFRLGAVLKIVVPVAVVVVSAFIFFGVFNGTQRLANLMKPSLVTVTGNVLLNGKPLPNAEVATFPVKPGLHGAIGTADENGHFKLMTHVNGEFLNGAYEGEHRVTVVKRHNVPSMGLAPLMTPAKYESLDSTPLRMIAAEGQSVEFQLEGELSAPPPYRPPVAQRPPSGYPSDTNSEAPLPEGQESKAPQQD